MRILITGSNGQVAHELINLIPKEKFSVSAFTKKELDITDLNALQNKFEIVKPDIVINTAAYTKVDQAEDESDLAFLVNRDGAKNLAMFTEEFKIPLLHLSTDYIFDGLKNSPYVENDPVNPLSVYGQSKWEGEEAIRKYCSRYIILRVSAVFGSHGTNFVKSILRAAREKESLKVVSDQTICPTPARAIAETLWKLCSIDDPKWGTYHFCGDFMISWHAFASHIVNEAKKHVALTVKQIESISSNEYATRAKRPKYSVLDCDLLQKTFGIARADWQKYVNEMISELSLEGSLI